MKNIIITGGAGFIGSHVVRLFVNKYPEYHIINLDKLTYAGNLANLKDIEDKPNYTFVKGDICDFDLMLKLMPDSMADVLLIKFRISVFGVSKQWMSCSCKVSTNLVSTACDQLNFQKSYFSVAAKRTIFRFNRQGIFEFLSAYDYFVCFFIFVQITPDMIRFFYFAFCEADVVFVKCSVVEYLGQKLQTGKAFTCTDHSAGITVKSVTYRRSEGFELFFCKVTFL